VFHEAVGHAKEGHRYQIGQNHDGFLGEVTTFAGKPKRVAPEFISLYDDPNDTSTIGHYVFDDEGVRAQRVPLIRNGAQLELLHSRQSAGYFEKRSNGHGRAELHQDPVSRMGVLILESDNKFPIEALYDKLIELVRKGRHDYGLVFQGGHRGASATEEDFYQMVPQSIIRVYPDGRKERVRGAINAGTPLETLAKIYATSEPRTPSNSHCGAESGWIPVGQVMPWTLFKSLEINPLKEEEYEQFPRHILSD
jgi:TldD protein